MGELRLMEVGKRLFADPLPPFPLEKGQQYAFSVKTASGNVASHNYTSTPTCTNASPPPQRFHVVGIRTPGGRYDKGLMPGPSPKRKERDEFFDSSPRVSKIRRHISPPPITRPGGQYESENDKVLKRPKMLRGRLTHGGATWGSANPQGRPNLDCN
ncbi:hypothetical protein C2845_PM05G20080 [Panicum miliaceum]|uniref:Uncharacterized protein n=1 Tax=Panicum miliaceum TaxID=4540 RepID=A0A3L6SZ32_PANMI|nr:hypothetical protein C2845_PM05G20080 [Panicum miliaceum]